jgi:hypothetical protein
MPLKLHIYMEQNIAIASVFIKDTKNVTDGYEL